jgi:hypothetical protein
MIRIGLISDAHGLLRPAVPGYLRGTHRITITRAIFAARMC